MNKIKNKRSAYYFFKKNPEELSIIKKYLEYKYGFTKDGRSKYKPKDIDAEMAIAWSRLHISKKKKYKKMADKDKQRFEKEYESYKKEHEKEFEKPIDNRVTAYNLFINDQNNIDRATRETKKENPTEAQIKSELYMIWKSLSCRGRRDYRMRANRISRDYEASMNEYNLKITPEIEYYQSDDGADK